VSFFSSTSSSHLFAASTGVLVYSASMIRSPCCRNALCLRMPCGTFAGSHPTLMSPAAPSSCCFCCSRCTHLTPRMQPAPQRLSLP
jgi:hypothetical protein